MDTINQYLNQCIPVLTVLVLILVIVLCIRLIVLLGNVNKTVTKLDGTVDMVNDYLTELKVPVRVLVNVSMSVEALRAASEDTVRRMSESISEQMRALTEWIKKFWDSLSQLKKETADVEVVTITPEVQDKGDL